NEVIQLSYKAPVSQQVHTGGLLSLLTDARQGLHQFDHDDDGFLKQDTPPDGAYQSLARTALAPAHVTRTTALGRTTTYSVFANSADDFETSNVSDPAGLTTTTTIKPDRSTST